ncbi:hypothetical protein GCM10027355_16440 [Haloplanus salinarum]
MLKNFLSAGPGLFADTDTTGGMTALDSTVLSVVALIGLLAASAFFSSTEIAVFSLSGS